MHIHGVGDTHFANTFDTPKIFPEFEWLQMVGAPLGAEEGFTTQYAWTWKDEFEESGREDDDLEYKK